MEVYGVKPKIFTKEWWPYFWDYYKLHTFAAIFATIIIIVTVRDCVSKVNYDLQVDVITENSVSQEALDALSDNARENIEDVTKNGKTEVYVNYLYMNEADDPQYFEAMTTKMMVEAGYTEGFVFLVSKKYADYMSGLGAFKPASDWTDVPSYDGYCISLEDCETLKDLGFDTSDLCLGIIELRERDSEKDREKNRPKQEIGIKFAKYLTEKR